MQHPSGINIGPPKFLPPGLNGEFVAFEIAGYGTIVLTRPQAQHSAMIFAAIEQLTGAPLPSLDGAPRHDDPAVDTLWRQEIQRLQFEHDHAN
jgi:hypothetical protein